MGCPDWPKCFGQWIPPTDISQLPENYETDYLDIRKGKLERYIKLIDGIGLPHIAQQMREDDTLLESEPFDARGTWIEYVNRLFGFMSGNLMLALFVVSLWWWKRSIWIPIVAFVSLIAIGFQAWLGSVVVATNLLPWTITIHMVVAFLIIALLILMVHRARGADMKYTWDMRWLLGLAILLTLVQVVLGTQVRQEIDYIAKSVADRSEWIGMLSDNFEIHRSFSILILLVNVGFILRNKAQLAQSTALKAIGLFLMAEILVGVILSYGDMLRYAQPTHLLLATLVFGAQCWVFFSNQQAGIRPA